MLQDRLRSLSNVDIKTNAKTTEVVGEDHVTGIRYEDMSTGEEHLLNLDGIFVQIGLLPNTSWLKDAVELNERGEIVIDRNNNTNVPGIFCWRCNRSEEQTNYYFNGRWCKCSIKCL